MDKYIDLHFHSTHSDGMFSPKEIAKKAKERNLAVLSLTDHNSVSGIDEMIEAGEKQGIRIVKGIEFYTRFYGQDLHLLGYGINHKAKKLQELLGKARTHHLEWAMKVLKKLESLGYTIDFEDLKKIRSYYLGLGHLKDILMKEPQNQNKVFKEVQEMRKRKREILKKKVETIHEPSPRPVLRKYLEEFAKEIEEKRELTLFEVIEAFFGREGIAFIEGEHLDIPTQGAIKLVLEVGGIPVLAHPGQQLSWGKDYLIYALKKQGLQGLEVITPYHNWHSVEHYQKLANELELVITGGSDLHGDLMDPELKSQFIHNRWDYFRVPYEVWENLSKVISF